MRFTESSNIDINSVLLQLLLVEALTMPLVILSGFPASGKTTRAKELAEFMRKEWPKNVIIISEHEFVKDEDKDYTYSCE